MQADVTTPVRVKDGRGDVLVSDEPSCFRSSGYKKDTVSSTRSSTAPHIQKHLARYFLLPLLLRDEVAMAVDDNAADSENKESMNSEKRPVLCCDVAEQV